MRTRCPVCSTIFRVTSEQLRLKAGKVRCGHCQAVFNAFDEFLTETVAPHEAVEPSGASAGVIVPSTAPERIASLEPVNDELSAPLVDEAPSPSVVVADIVQAANEIAPVVAVEPDPVVAPSLEIPEVSSIILLETPEESAMAAREAGLMAARELNDAPGYNRWAAGAFAGQGLERLESEPHRAVWPFVIFSLLLIVVLLGQLLFYFRTDLAQRYPSASKLYHWAEVDVPLPRNVELVAIETSDLQSDNARGLFVLQANLHNRASYAQAWPALELTLTDTNDTVVSRRVLMAADYLPPATDLASFPANGETPVKLWIEAKDIGAAGYRLYIFYP